MNLLEDAIIYATTMHQGKHRKGSDIPYILHPLEVAQIISTMTEDVEIIAAGVLHDVVEDTDGTIEDIRLRFGDRVANIVATETEEKYREESPESTWKRRKEESLKVLKNCGNDGTRMVWLADKLANIRSLARMYGEKGSEMWNLFHMQDPEEQRWYYRTVAEELELYLNKTGAFKEFVQEINYIWPETFLSEKEKFKQYTEYSVDGCEVIGRGAKGTIYRYNDEVIIKVFNENNTFKDIEREVYLARCAFVLGIPTSISFGIISVGKCYGAMYELLNSDSIAKKISRNPASAPYYAKLMAGIAKDLHQIDGSAIDCGNMITDVLDWIDTGVALVDEGLTSQVRKFVDGIPAVTTLIHGDFHAGNIMLQNNEPFLIDMDSLSTGHPIIELSGIYMFYIGFGEYADNMIEDFMGFSKETSRTVFDEFVQTYYAEASEAERKREVDRAALLCYVRLLRRVYKTGVDLSPEKAALRDRFTEKIRALLDVVEPYSE